MFTKTIIVASENPVKQKAALAGFLKMFPADRFTLQGVSVGSGVRHQPLSDAETYQGAVNRAAEAAGRYPEADFWVGIEGGVEESRGEWRAFAWVVIRSAAGQGKSRTGVFILPPPVADLLQQGVELGTADDIVFNRSDSKRENGAVGILTDNVIDRTAFYEHAVVLALIPFKNASLYPNRP